MRKTIFVVCLMLSFSAAASTQHSLSLGRKACHSEIIPNSYKSLSRHLPSHLKNENSENVLAMIDGIVALGEKLYTLSSKFKPTISTEYAPVNVVPIDPITKIIVTPMELQGFSEPVIKTVKTICHNAYNMPVVTFVYNVLYSYGGSDNGRGQYISSVILIPSYVNVAPGWTFTSTMKVASIMNHGTVANPVAGVFMTMKYTVNSLFAALEKNDTLHIKGSGQFRTMIEKFSRAQLRNWALQLDQLLRHATIRK